MHALKLLAVSLAALAGAAQAQVIRCTDPATGRVTYTDAGCPSQQQARQIMRKPTEDELLQMEMDAARARDRLRREQFDRELRTLNQTLQQIATSPRSTPHAGSSSPQCQRALRELSFERPDQGRSGSTSAAMAAVDAACGVYAAPYAPRQAPTRSAIAR